MPKPLHTLIIGAGFAGIDAAVKLRAEGIDNFIIAEKTGGISGTWHDNTYPGATCDVPSHLYSFSYAPNPNWSRRFAPSAEIEKYAQDVVEQYDLKKHIRAHTKITSARFDTKSALWHINTKAEDSFQARFLVVSVAILGTPQFPNIKGIDSFKGSAFHSARWNHDANLKGKRVAIIGSAASAVQITPPVSNMADKLYVLQRTPNYVIPRGDRAYTNLEKFLFNRLPFYVKVPRILIYLYLDLMFIRGFKQGSFFNKYMTSLARKFRKKQIKDDTLRAKLTPDYPMGCKRVLLSDNYYTALQKNNVELVTDAIEHITPKGILMASGREIQTDILVFATGFNATDFMPGLNLTGIHGATLKEWRKTSYAHKGLTIENMPNAFFMLGPNTYLGHSSMILMIEAQNKYMLQLMGQIGEGQYASPKPKAVKDYNNWLHGQFSNTIWATSCASWYKREDGSIPTIWPFPTYKYTKMMKRSDTDEFDFNH
ncbi:MAG: NAD(P)/FAD-dependent oxidoreductase [Robiginitomaculum sp.]